MSKIDARRRPSAWLAWPVLAALFLVAAACSDSPSQVGGDGTLQVVVTGSSAQSMMAALTGGDDVAFDEEGENPMTGENVESVEVWISRIYLVGGGQGQVDLFNAADEGEEPIHMDLMTLVGDPGVEIELTEAVPVPDDGNYGQLRLEVDDVIVTLAGDATFADGSNEKHAMLPSGFLRINLNGDLSFEGGEDVVLLADFDMSRSFAFQGPPTAPLGVVLKPVLFQEVARNEG